MFPLNLHLISKNFEVTMVDNSFHSNHFSKIMVLFSNTLVFTCPNKMGWWNANIATIYKLHEPWNFKLNSLLNFGENVHSLPSISSTAYLHPSLLQNTIWMPLLETTYLLSPSCVWLSSLCYQCPCLSQIRLSCHHLYLHWLSCWTKSIQIVKSLHQKIFTSRNVRFHENHFSYASFEYVLPTSNLGYFSISIPTPIHDPTPSHITNPSRLIPPPTTDFAPSFSIAPNSDILNSVAPISSPTISKLPSLHDE